MKHIFLLAGFVFLANLISAQNKIITPKLILQFDDKMSNHNMHIASDGRYYYTVNGGNTTGIVNKYSLNGDFIKTYSLPYDMRTIMYNSKDGLFYISTNDKEIYKITNLETGSCRKILPNLYDEGQATLGISNDGAFIYYFHSGTLKKYDISSGSLIKTFSNLQYGSGSVCAVAVDDDYIYTLDTDNHYVYAHDLNGIYKTKAYLPNGCYKFSLSAVNGLIFVSKDGNYNTGTWYGYQIKYLFPSTPGK